MSEHDGPPTQECEYQIGRIFEQSTPELHACSHDVVFSSDALKFRKLECETTIQRAVSYPIDYGCTFEGDESLNNHLWSPNRRASTPRPRWDSLDNGDISQPLSCTPTHCDKFPKVDCLLCTPSPTEIDRLDLFFPILGSAPRKRTSEVLNQTQSDHRVSLEHLDCDSPDIIRHSIVTPQQDSVFPGKIPYRGAVLSNEAASLIVFPPFCLRDKYQANYVRNEDESGMRSLGLKPYQPRRKFSLTSYGIQRDDVKSIFNKKTSLDDSFCDMSRSQPDAPYIHSANPVNSDLGFSVSSSFDDGYVEGNEVIWLNDSNLDCKESSELTLKKGFWIDSMSDESYTYINGSTTSDFNPSTDTQSPPIFSRCVAHISTRFNEICMKSVEEHVFASSAKRHRKKDEDAIKWLESIAVHRDDNIFVAEAVSSKFLTGKLSVNREKMG